MKEFIEIPFGAKDSELGGWEYTIPEGYTASIENGKIIVKKEESEDERIRKEILEYFQQFENEELRGVNISDWIAWLEKQGVQNPTDEEMKILLQTEYEKGKADAIEAAMKAVTKDKESAIKFLKSAGIINDNGKLAKEYVVDDVEQKPAWSDEDENTIEKAICVLEVNFEPNEEFSGLDIKRYQLVDRLKALKDRVQPQPEWKPSDEQMKQLKSAANIYPDSRLGHALKSLYQDLMTYQNNLKL